MQTGALIAAAGKTSEMTVFRPMLRLNGTTLIQKEIDTLRRADVSPIVVVTGYEAEELEKHLAHRGVVCIRNREYENTQMLDSVKIGLRYLKDHCDRVFFLPADAPLFSVESLEEVMASQAEFAIPSFGSRTGHPILIDGSMIPGILKYDGDRGLRGAMAESGVIPEIIPVQDRGVLMEVNDEKDYREVLEYEKNTIYRDQLTMGVELNLGKTTSFFTPQTAEFLTRIDLLGSMLAACKSMSMSYSRGWKMIKEAEDSMGFLLLDKRAGGSSGGNSRLTEQGRDFLECYHRLQSAVTAEAERKFREYFAEYLLESDDQSC